MKFIKMFLIVILTLALTSCATSTVPFTEGRPVEAKGTFWTRSYVQNGKAVRYDVVDDALEKYDSSEETAKAAQIWAYAGIASAAVGGGLLGYYLFDAGDSSTTRSTGFLLGAVFVGLGFLSAYFGDRDLVEATHIYNNEVKYRGPRNSSHESFIRPTFGVTTLNNKSDLIPVVGLQFAGF